MNASLTILEDYIKNRDEISELMKNIIKYSDELNLSDESIILDEFKNKLAENIFRIIVIGEFKRGKSTFINAMLGQKVLPVGVTPTTATVNILKYSENPYVKVKYKSGEEKDIELSELNSYVTTKNKEADKISIATIYYPAKICKEQVEIVDSPGVNDIDEQRVEITYDFIPKCDAAIFIMNITQQLSASEREFLTERVDKYINKIFFLLNKTDQLEEAEQTEAINYVKSELGKIADNPKIFPVSAKTALNGRIENNPEAITESKIEDFESALFSFLMEEKGKIILASALQRSANSIYKMKTMLELKLKAYQMSLNDVEERLKQAKKEFNTLDYDKKHILEAIDQKKLSLIELINTDSKMSVYNLTSQVEKFINDTSFTDQSELQNKTIKFLENAIQLWGKKEEEIIQAEISNLLEYINLKTSNIQKKINQIQFDFLGSDSINLDNKINIDSFQKSESLFDMLPKFLGKEGGEFSGIARGALFIIGASILTGGALIPAILLGSSASFVTGKIMNDWTDKKHKKQLFDNIKIHIEKVPEMVIPQLIANLEKSFEDNLKKQINQEIDAMINIIGKTLDEIENEKQFKASETEGSKNNLERILNELHGFENQVKEIADRLI